MGAGANVGHRWALGANVVQAFVAWGLLLVLVHLGTEKDVGHFAYLQALLSPVQLFFTLKLRTIQCSDSTRAYSPSTYHQVRRQAALLCLFAGASLLAAVGDEKELMFAGGALVLSYSVMILRESYVAVAQFERKNQTFFQLSAINGFVSFASFLLTFWVTKSLANSLWVLAVARLTSYVVFERSLFNHFFRGVLSAPKAGNQESLSPKVWKTAWPLGLTALMGALFTALPRFVVKDELGFDSLAVYATVGSLLVFFNLVVNSFVQAALPGLAHEYLTQRSHFTSRVWQIVKRLMLLGIAALLGAELLGEFTLKVVFGSEYAEHSDLLPFVVASGLSLAWFSIANLLLSSQRTFFIQFPLYAATALVIWLASVVLVPAFGIAGAFSSQILGYLIGSALSWLIFLQIEKGDRHAEGRPGNIS